MKTFPNEAILAVAKVVKDKAASAASKEVAPGEYKIDLLVRILGLIKKGEDYTQTVSDKITVDWKLLACLFANKLNKETQNVVTEEFIAAMDNPEAQAELADDLKRSVENRISKVKKVAERIVNCSGKVTTDLSMELVGASTVQPA